MSPTKNQPDLTQLPPLPDDPDGEETEAPETENPPSRTRASGRRRGRRAARSSTYSSASSEAGKRGQQLRQIRDELDQAFVLIGSLITPIAPVTGATLVGKGPNGSSIVVSLAKRDERVLRALLAAAHFAVYGELAMFVGTIGVAVGVDIYRQSEGKSGVNPNSLMARRMVGDDILSTVFAVERSSNGTHPQPSSPAVPSGWPAPASPAG